eukprot:6844821-Alexandrium_andersonii.AAC.1
MRALLQTAAAVLRAEFPAFDIMSTFAVFQLRLVHRDGGGGAEADRVRQAPRAYNDNVLLSSVSCRSACVHACRYLSCLARTCRSHASCNPRRTSVIRLRTRAPMLSTEDIAKVHASRESCKPVLAYACRML